MKNVPKLLPEETLRQGFPKINMVIDGVNYFQKQIDEIVVEGDSSVEAAQARVNESGQTFSTLKSRLDASDSQLAQKAPQAELNETKSDVEAANLRIDTLVIGSGNANAEVDDAKVSTAKNRLFTTVRNRFEEIEKDTFIPLTNLINNGNFVGITGWSSIGSTSTAIDNILTNTGSGTNASPSTFQSTNIDLVNGKKYFVKLRVRVLNASNRIRLVFNGTVVANASEIKRVNDPIINQWYDVSGIFTVTNQEGKLRLYVHHDYVDATTAQGKVMEVQFVSLIDLGVTSGYETATESELNTLLSRFTNSWVSGTVNLFNAKEVLMKLKSDPLSEVLTAENQNWEVEA